MRLELGLATHPSPNIDVPTVTYIHLDEGHSEVTSGADVRDLALVLAQNPGNVTRLHGQTAFLAVVRGHFGDGNPHGEKPTWVHVEEDDGSQSERTSELERLLSDYYGIPRGKPADLEATHYTNNGLPGVGGTE